MMKQYVDIKNQYEDVIIFFRLGDFYEMFFEDAVLASRLLELTLTGKSAGLESRIPMCGIPHHSAQIYIEKLVELGYKVGICEQLEDAKDVKGIVKRDVVQIISKGTIINNESLVEYENNYIGNLVYFNHAYGLSYTDISTGELYVQLLEPNISKVVSEVVNIGLKEIVVTDKVDKNIISILERQFKLIITVHETFDVFEYQPLYSDLEDVRMIETLKHLLSYIDKTQKRSLSHFQKAIIRVQNQFLKMDIHTKRNLELTETLRSKERHNSLIWLLDKTKTAMGSRLLKKYIEAPLINKDEINKRYDIVDTLTKEFILKSDLIDALEDVYDLERLSGRVAFGNSNARDLIQLKSSLKVLPAVSDILTKINYHKNIDTLDDLYQLLEKGIYETPPISIKEGYLIKTGFNTELDELKDLRKGGKDFLARFETEEKERTGIKNLKIGYNKVFGYYIEISKGNITLVKDEFGYERKQTLSNCERYISPILKEKEALILNAEEKIIELEYELFIEIRDKIKSYIPTLQEISKTISEIDVLQSFSTVAEENNYVRPVLTDERFVNITSNRHPVVEKVIETEFVPNNIIMDKNTDILLITGPNMAGKSTYMRQMAITVIMAQIGSFVPASEAVMPIFDAIFTRIGASDDLVSGESTFMVEMNEANYAISNATAYSLILFDELGRGTATFDGMALAQAIIEYIHDEIKAKTMFSTHYHELTDLENNLDKLRNIHVSAYEENGNITFLHKIKPGSVDKSYGIHVAKLANLPSSLINRANTILHVYENNEVKRDIKIQQALPLEEVISHEKSLVEKELEQINPIEITPMEALNILYKLKQKIHEKPEEEVKL
ncbi:MAG: DNA mismatch repair protein MutS [Bacilli bacterium]|nr:DNA mismatch repair protein MutS [Bacilli bacterium]MDD4282966.1 DNA mismatch repair protein MutS [Bacilli bacterium]MDD4719172.1 DNA mismatch repair protein MutS [Bacilli bacterium]